MAKKIYQKPTTKVYQIQVTKLLAGSGGGEGGSGARRFSPSWDDEE